MTDSPEAVTESARGGRPLRVLQLVADLQSGGAERWVVDLCGAGPSEGLEMNIAVLHPEPGLFYDRASALGIPIYPCAGSGHPLSLISNLRRLIRTYGPYDAIHCHIHAAGAFAVIAARLEDVPARVVHSHNVVKNAELSWVRRSYAVVARQLLNWGATAGLGPSAMAVADLFGAGWRADPRWNVLPCGIDLTPFRTPAGDGSSRAALGIPDDAFVLGSVGRLYAEKNSAFLVDVLGAALRIRPDAYLLLIGEGPLREQLESKAQEGGFRDRLVLAGVRSDVAALMRNVMDVFVCPSPRYEALGIAVVEAQAAGLPTVISDGVPGEAVLVPALVRQISADDSAEVWADAVIAQAQRRDPDLARRALEVIERSNHNGAVSVKTLARLYRHPEACPRTIIEGREQPAD